jgi:hypothetical protein
MTEHYPQVAERAAHRCEFCRAPEAVFNFPFEVEHVVPLAQGGADTDQNRALACRACNLYKSDQLGGVDPQTGLWARLFHPRLDHWTEHFLADPLTGAITGLTPVGRISIALLRMNTPRQLRARQAWRWLGYTV